MTIPHSFSTVTSATGQQLDDNFSAVAIGDVSQPFLVGAPTVAGNAVPLSMVSLFPTVPSAISTNIFGAAGATISIDNSTPVTTTSFTACTSAQVGSVKRVIPVQAWSVTASANLVVDGATSGTFVMPAGAKLEVLASTTTLFQLTTIQATGTWTPNQGPGLTVVGTFSSSGYWSKTGNQITIHFILVGTTTVAVSAAGIMTTNIPFTVNSNISGHGNCTDAGDSISGGCKVQLGTTSIYSAGAIGASAQINCSAIYLV